jgi:hypothetical protein
MAAGGVRSANFDKSLEGEIAGSSHWRLYRENQNPPKSPFNKGGL